VDAGTRARLSPTAVELPGCTVVLEGARPWRGPLPRPEAVRSAAGTITEAAGEVIADSLLPDGAATEARALVAADDLEGAALVLAGLGPGLTPSGDDVLGGLVFASRAARGPEEEQRLAAVVDGVRTMAIARAFLRWAARGQALAPAHDLLRASADGDRERARAAARALAAVGESSGADFALGLVWGFASAGRPRP
jgi:hypothetical protein